MIIERNFFFLQLHSIEPVSMERSNKKVGSGFRFVPDYF